VALYAIALVTFSLTKFASIAYLFLWFALPPTVLYGIGFEGFLNAAFSLRPLRWLGNISYTFFLAHGLILNGIAVGMRELGIVVPALLFPLLFMLNLALVVGGSWAIFLLIERPFSLTKHPCDAAGESGNQPLESALLPPATTPLVGSGTASANATAVATPEGATARPDPVFHPG
jgi:peptidoglycan/LPS O-acetylase OafA/YrhL